MDITWQLWCGRALDRCQVLNVLKTRIRQEARQVDVEGHLQVLLKSRRENCTIVALNRFAKVIFLLKGLLAETTCIRWSEHVRSTEQQKLRTDLGKSPGFPLLQLSLRSDT